MQIYPEIAIVVPTKDRPTAISDLMASVAGQSLAPAEVIIVDASGSDTTRRVVQQWCSAQYPFHLKWLGASPSATRQRNIGVRAATADIVVLLDDDVVLENDFLQQIADGFGSDSSIVGVVGRITNMSSTVRPVDRLFKKLFFLNDHGRGRLKPSGFPELYIGALPRWVKVAPGGCVAYRRKTLLDTPLDENLGGYAYMEDIDLSYRISQIGRILYQPAAKLAHYTKSHSSMSSRQLRKIILRNHVYLFRKNVPKDFFHVIAFTISVIGLFIYNAFVARDRLAVSGLLEALIDPIPMNRLN